MSIDVTRNLLVLPGIRHYHACIGYRRPGSLATGGRDRIMQYLVRKLAVVAAAVAALSAVPVAHADTVRAECGFGGAGDTPPGDTSACTFSQRQGYIRIAIDGGPEFELSPVGEKPGSYADPGGNAVYRRSGLGERGMRFEFPDQHLYVYWTSNQLDCSADRLTSPDGCSLAYGKLVLRVRATDVGSINRLSIEPAGLAAGDTRLEQEIDGTVQRAEIADLDSDGWPELFVYVSSAGSGSYGSVVAYAVNNGRSMTPIYLPPIAADASASRGYMGHDEFAVVENRLVQRFPIYREGDTNSEPSGGMRQVQYRLTRGEAGWILAVDKIVEY